MKKCGQLTDGVITLRPYRLSDIDSVYEAVCESIPELSVWMSWCHPDYSIEETRTWIESQPDKCKKEQNTTSPYRITANRYILAVVALTLSTVVAA